MLAAEHRPWLLAGLLAAVATAVGRHRRPAGTVFLACGLVHLWRARNSVPVVVGVDRRRRRAHDNVRQLPPNPPMLLCAFPLLIVLAAQIEGRAPDDLPHLRRPDRAQPADIHRQRSCAPSHSTRAAGQPPMVDSEQPNQIAQNLPLSGPIVTRHQHVHDRTEATVAPGIRESPVFRGFRKCAREDSNLHGLISPQGPQPCASTNSATGAWAASIAVDPCVEGPSA
jgi:hypothetical protein